MSEVSEKENFENEKEVEEMLIDFLGISFNIYDFGDVYAVASHIKLIAKHGAIMRGINELNPYGVLASAVCFQRIGLYDQAILYYSRTLRLINNDEEHQFFKEIIKYRGWCYYYRKLTLQALEDFEKILKLSNEDDVALIGRGNCLIDLTNWKAATETFLELSEIYPMEERAYLGLGICAAGMRKWEKSNEHFFYMLMLGHKRSSIFGYVSNNYYELGEYKSALQYVNQAISGYNPKDELSIRGSISEYYLTKGKIFRELGKHKKCIIFLTKAIFQNDYCVEKILEERGLCYLQCQKYGHALEDFVEIAVRLQNKGIFENKQHRKNYPSLNFYIGIICEALNKRQEATKVYIKEMKVLCGYHLFYRLGINEFMKSDFLTSTHFLGRLLDLHACRIFMKNEPLWRGLDRPNFIKLRDILKMGISKLDNTVKRSKEEENMDRAKRWKDCAKCSIMAFLFLIRHELEIMKELFSIGFCYHKNCHIFYFFRGVCGYFLNLHVRCEEEELNRQYEKKELEKSREPEETENDEEEEDFSFLAADERHFPKKKSEAEKNQRKVRTESYKEEFERFTKASGDLILAYELLTTKNSIEDQGGLGIIYKNMFSFCKKVIHHKDEIYYSERDLKSLGKMIISKSDRYNFLICEGKRLIKEKKYHQAIARFKDASTIFKYGCFRVMIGKANAYFAMGGKNRKKSLKFFKKARKLKKTYFGCYGRGIMFKKLGKCEEAVMELSNCLELNPVCYRASYERGKIYFNQYMEEKSRRIEEEKKSGIYLEKRRKRVTGNLRVITKPSKKKKKKEKKVYGEYPDLSIFLEKSLIDFDNCLKYELQNYKYYRDRGRLLGEMGLFKRALSDFEQAIEIEKKDPSNLLFRMLCKKKMFEDCPSQKIKDFKISERGTIRDGKRAKKLAKKHSEEKDVRLKYSEALNEVKKFFEERGRV